MRTEHDPVPRRRRSQVQRCVCCGVLLYAFERQAGKRLCSACRDHTRPYSCDPYDELGGGD